MSVQAFTAKKSPDVTSVQQQHPLSLIDGSAERSHGARPRVAVVRWSVRDELAEAIAASAEQSGYDTVYFDCCGTLPRDVDIVFSFAPYGSFMTIVKRIEEIPEAERPVLIHWNTEGIPDVHLPWAFVYPVSYLRSAVGRLAVSNSVARSLADRPPLNRLHSRMLRYRYVGDYYYAYRHGLLNVFADSSAVYAEIHRSHGLPTLHLPWGAVPAWYEEQHRERDIDVLWIGKHGSKRRSDLLDRVRGELARAGVDIYVADNEEHPFVFREERTEMLNRAKITLNITRTWYDDNFSRFAMAVPNRSLVVSEPMLPHCPQYQAGTHYVSAPIEELSSQILYYLENVEARRKITDAAYDMVVNQLTLTSGVRNALEQAETALEARRAPTGRQRQ